MDGTAPPGPINDVMRRDALTTFRDLGVLPSIADALERVGIVEPFPIQEMALPVALLGNDLIGQARTGSGKTLAFLIPAVELIDVSRPAVQVLVLTPTRELAVQIDSVLSDIASDLGIRSVLIFGGRSVKRAISLMSASKNTKTGIERNIPRFRYWSMRSGF